MKKQTRKKKPSIATDWTPIPVGIVLAVIGVCFIAFSQTIEYLALAVGIFVIVGATVLGTVTLLGKKSGAAFVLKIAFAVAALATGIITIIFKDGAAAIICVVLSGALAVDGSVKLGAAIQAKQYSIAGRTVAVVLAVLTTVSSLAMVRCTPEEITDENIGTYAIIIGITFILDAVTNVVNPFLRHGINTRIVNDVIEQSTPKEEQKLSSESAEEPKEEKNAESKEEENTAPEEQLPGEIEQETDDIPVSQDADGLTANDALTDEGSISADKDDALKKESPEE